jgi:hypothetical protein
MWCIAGTCRQASSKNLSRGPGDVDEQAAVCGFDQIAGPERLAMLYYSQIP